tara:strand:+ start:2848 stop:3048 length:201 start_codon:yes stop_codon:yes gene_type:complete
MATFRAMGVRNFPNAMSTSGTGWNLIQAFASGIDEEDDNARRAYQKKKAKQYQGISGEVHDWILTN